MRGSGRAGITRGHRAEGSRRAGERGRAGLHREKSRDLWVKHADSLGQPPVSREEPSLPGRPSRAQAGWAGWRGGLR